MLPVHLSKPPKTLGRFEVGAKIGGGGMATVFLGRDVREDGSEELVALKVIREELAHDEQFSAMFIDEAKILARLSHPNVIQTLEYGITNGHRFIAMELLNGRTVSDTWDVLVAENERFELGTAAWICARVAEGVHSAHELVDETGAPLSVIHRDVNPTNIFLTHLGEVKLIDFGLARARIRVSKSADGIVKGKIPYLAPEQAHGKPIDRRIDIYALGTTLWEMSTMKRLFKRDNDIDTLRAIRDARVPDPRDESPDFPEALWKIIERALRRDRDERYATAEEMRTDLDAFARTTAPQPQKIAALVSRLFPGGEARQEKFLRQAAALRVPATTMEPPAPVPIASSSGIDDEGNPSIPPPMGGEGRPLSTTLPPRRVEGAPLVSGTVEIREKAVAGAPDSDVKKESLATPSPQPPKRPKGDKKKAKGKSKRVYAVADEGAPRTEDKRRLWLIVTAAVLGLLVLAALSSR